MRHIDNYISESFSWQEAKNYLFECLDRTDDYNFELTLDSCPKLADYYCLSELNISREFRNHPEYIYLALIVVNEEDRYAGYGTGFMEDLCEWADTRGKIITLTPDDDFGASSRSRLVRFYKRFGFVENKGKNTDFTHKQYMHRKPNVTEAVARRTTGKYRKETLKDNPSIKDTVNFIKKNHIKMVGGDSWTDILVNMGTGVAVFLDYPHSDIIVLCPDNDKEHAFGLVFYKGKGDIREAIEYRKTKDYIKGVYMDIIQVVNVFNDLVVNDSFVTEAVVHGPRKAISIDKETDRKDFEKWLNRTGIDTVELNRRTIKDCDKYFGTGICYINDIRKTGTSRRDYVEYIICPKDEDFRFSLTYADDRCIGAFLQRILVWSDGSGYSTDWEYDTSDVFKEITDYYNG